MNYRINPLFLNYSFPATKYINLIRTEKKKSLNMYDSVLQYAGAATNYPLCMACCG